MAAVRRLLLLAVLALLPAFATAAGKPDTVGLNELPVEARQTLALIKRSGPFPYARDGIVFGNFEHRLPAQPRGYYHEYTVPTPGAKGRGARRIVVGEVARAAAETYYSDDHYRSFRRIVE